MNLTNDFKKEFDNYVISVAKEYDCDLSKDDLQIIYDSFFHKDVGIQDQDMEK